MRFLTALLPLVLAAAAASAAERNIIFFITDDESPTLGCYGDPVAVTPAIDQLAADGTRFTHAYATTASCSASRSVVMSGLHNHYNGQYGHTHHFHKMSSFHDTVSLSLPRALAATGYRTVQIGKYHVAPEEVFRFDTYLKGHARNPVQMAGACEPIFAADDDRPFFLYFATSDPHRGGGVDKRVTNMLPPDLFGNRPNGESHKDVDEVFYDPAKVHVPPFLPDTPESRLELANYYQSCSRIDRGLAKLVALLKKHGLYESTLIVFTADHGMAFPGAKTNVYEPALHVPFVVRNPYNKKRGVTNPALISHVDITPSLLDFAGGLDRELNRPKAWKPAKVYWKGREYAQKENRNGGLTFDRYHGRSWLDLLDQDTAEGWDEIIASHTFHEIQMYYPMRVIRDREYKLIWNIAHPLPYPFASDLWAASTWQAQWKKGPETTYGNKTVTDYVQRPEFEFFRIDQDPWESTNLATDPEYAEELASYKERLKQRQQELQDPWRIKWRYE